MSVRHIVIIFLFILGAGRSLSAESFFLVPFTNEGDRDADWIGAGFFENVSIALRSAGCEVISPEDEKIACAYLGVYSETAISADNVRKVADVLNVDKAVRVRYKAANGRIFLRAAVSIRGQKEERTIAFDDAAENIFSMQDALASALRRDGAYEYVPPKPVMVKVWKKKKLYTCKQENPYLKPYEWYARGLALRKTKPSVSMDYLIQTLRYDPEHVRALRVASDIAHIEQGLTDGALGFLLRADKIMVRRGESTTAAYADLMVRIADIYEDKKDSAKAQIYLSRGLEVWKKIRKGRADEYAAFLYAIAGIYANLGQVNTELDYLSMAREAVEKEGNTRSVRFAWLMKHMGELYVAGGSRGAAEPLFLKAESIFVVRGLDATAEYADCKFQRGLLYAERCETVKADAELRSAQRIYAGAWQYDKAKAAQKEADALFRK